MRSPEAPVTRRLANTIVTPSRVDIPIEKNVTKRVKEAIRALSFPALIDQELQEGVGDKQIIGALSDMEIADPHDGEMMECDVCDDDLLTYGDEEAGGMVQKRMSLWALRVENLRFFVGDLLGSVRHRLMLMQENQGVTKVQKS
ncbi:hypothetical protein Bca52824_051270 [Brassica carinata]|uniref:Uncharacterized protein n=1 Tax=Brassica carinata TaxID=52824 RepID=A0A8X7UHL2_BRACI|nr:hypothetical protein Bca52824_051270 [Brassica carinata]